jgi:2-polyprenyl-3-methyl-5-hydroxy-6-metoxy-1,4-benzoquinol methylase
MGVVVKVSKNIAEVKNMINYCPECQSIMKDKICCCGWQYTIINNIKYTRSKSDNENIEYEKLYNNIAQDDIQDSILSDDYREMQAYILVKQISLKPDDVVCDLGSGKGFTNNELKKRKVQKIVSIDITDKYFKSQTTFHDVEKIVSNAENLPFKSRFDVIIATDILEHVMNVGSFLDSCIRALKPNGRLIIKVPYNEDLGKYSRYRNSKYPFVHLRSFNKALLKSLIEMFDFKVKNIKKVDYTITRKRKIIDKNRIVREVFKRLKSIMEKKQLTPLKLNTKFRLFCFFFLEPIELIIHARKRM